MASPPRRHDLVASIAERTKACRKAVESRFPQHRKEIEISENLIIVLTLQKDGAMIGTPAATGRAIDDAKIMVDKLLPNCEFRMTLQKLLDDLDRTG